MYVIIQDERNGDVPMNSIKRFRNLISVLMLYAANIIVPEKKKPVVYTTVDVKKRITGKDTLRLTTADK